MLEKINQSFGGLSSANLRWLDSHQTTPNPSTVACDPADDTLFRRIIGDENPPLQPFLPPKLSRTYNLRAREHDYPAPIET